MVLQGNYPETGKKDRGDPVAALLVMGKLAASRPNGKRVIELAIQIKVPAGKDFRTRIGLLETDLSRDLFPTENATLDETRLSL